MSFSTFGKDLLDTDALSASLGKVDKVLVQSDAFIGGPDPSLRIKGVGIGVDVGISVNKVRRLAHGGLRNV
jgi:hypothetical protein